MVNMVALVEDCAQIQQGKKRGKTRLFCNHNFFVVDKITLYDLCMKYGYHKEVIHTIFNNWFIDTNITTSALRDIFESLRHVSSIQLEDDNPLLKIQKVNIKMIQNKKLKTYIK